MLTSGGAPTATEGATVLASLVRRAGSRMIVLAGGGVRDHNVRDLISVSGVREVHRRVTDEDDMRKFVRIVSALTQ